MRLFALFIHYRKTDVIDIGIVDAENGLRNPRAAFVVNGNGVSNARIHTYTVYV